MTFEDVFEKIPSELQSEVMQTDTYFKALRPMKFKRTVDKNGNKITYVASEYGISYMFKISDNSLSHKFQWYIVYNGKPETWHRRADYMEETLVEIAKNNYPLSMRIYNALKSCAGSNNCYGERCLARTVYAFAGQKRLTCHGSVELGIRHDDFCDAREFFHHLNEFIKYKIANGAPPPERIIVCRTKRSL